MFNQPKGKFLLGECFGSISALEDGHAQESVYSLMCTSTWTSVYTIFTAICSTFRGKLLLESHPQVLYSFEAKSEILNPLLCFARIGVLCRVPQLQAVRGRQHRLQHVDDRQHHRGEIFQESLLLQVQAAACGPDQIHMYIIPILTLRRWFLYFVPILTLRTWVSGSKYVRTLNKFISNSKFAFCFAHRLPSQG